MADTLLIRADGSPRIGAGHVMRCLALAQCWQRHGRRAVFAPTATTPSLTHRLETAGFAVRELRAAAGTAEDAAQTCALAEAEKAGWVAGDNYSFGASWQERIRSGGRRLLVLDDYGHAERYTADFVLNQNQSASAAPYTRRESFSRLLLGPRYALLRREFLRQPAGNREIHPNATKILVTLGGSDPANVTGKVLQALSAVRGLEVAVAAGGSNPNLDTLKAMAAGVPGVKLVVDATNMPELMAWAEVAIAAGGSTSWELAFMGLPSLVLVTADNQAANAAALDQAGVARNLGRHEAVSPETIAAALEQFRRNAAERERMSRRARELVDGHGSARVVSRLLAEGISLRRAQAEDARLLWEWANDPAVRAASFSTAQIPWEDHVRWFEGRLKSDQCAIFLASNGTGRLIGQVRLEWPESDQAFVDVSIAAAFRGTGLGAAMLRRAADEALATLPVRELHAFIKPENQASIRAFTHADFSPAPPGVVQGREVMHFQAVKADE